jgi:hypothetical protein
MNGPVIIETVRRSDGRRFPVPDEAEQRRARVMIHNLVCRDQLSPEVAAERLGAYQLDRSPELIRADLAETSCEHCPGPPEPQLAQDEPVRPVVHQAAISGYLTRMISDGW